MKPIAILTALAAVLLVAAAAGTALVTPARGGSAAVDGGITVNGLGSVQTVPDRAQFSFDVQAAGATAAQALERAAAESNAVNAALRNAGIARADLQTAQISLQPRRSEKGDVTGFDATTTVTARLKDLARTGRVVDAAVKAGASSVYGPALSKADTDALYDDALEAAVANARAKAQVLAAASGVVLGRVTNVVEGGAVVPLMASRPMAAAKADVSVEPGTQEITAGVTVTFAAG